eukprot:6470859-Amphidinium_carterae.2
MSEPEPEASGPLLPFRDSAVGDHRVAARGQAPSSTSSTSTTVSTQTLPLPVSLEARLVSGLRADPVYIVWCVGETSTLPPGIHIGTSAWVSILEHIPGGTYRSGVDRLRRLPHRASDSQSERLQAAIALYASEARRHHISECCRVHFW